MAGYLVRRLAISLLLVFLATSLAFVLASELSFIYSKGGKVRKSLEEPALREDAATNVVDFMALLQKSLDTKKRTPAKAPAKKAPAKKTPRKAAKAAKKAAAKKAARKAASR